MATAALEGVSIEQNEIIPVLGEVRVLDKNISEKVAIFNNIEVEKNRLVTSVKNSQNECAEYNSKNEVKKARLQTLEGTISEKSVDEALIEKLSGMRQEADQYRKLLEKKTTIVKDINETKKILEDQYVLVKNTEEPIKKIQETQLKDQNELNDIEKSLKSILNGKDILSYRDEKEKFKSQEDSFKRMIDLCEKGIKRKKLREDKIQEKNVLMEKLELAKYNISQNKTALETKEKEVELLEENYKLTNAVVSLTTHRKSLVDGSPCPLCGSLEHPYAIGNIPVLRDAEIKLTTAKNELKTLEKDKSELQKNDATWQNELTIIDSYVKEMDDLHKLDKESLDNSLKALNLNSDSADFGESLEKVDEQNQINLQNVTKILNEAEALEKRLNSKNEDIKRNYQALQEANSKLTGFKDKIQQHEGYLKGLETNQSETESALVLQQNLLNNKLLPFGHKLTDPNSLTNIFEDLLKRQQNFIKFKEEKLELQKEITELSAKIEESNKSIAENLKQSEEFAIDQAKLMSDKEELSKKRFNLFENKQVDEEEKRLRTKFENATKDYNNFQEKYNSSSMKLKGLQSKLDEIKRIAQESELKRKEMEESFKIAYQNKGFDSESLFLEARLDDKERSRLVNRQKHLMDETTSLNSLIEEKNKSLELEKAKNLSELSLNDLKQELATLQNDLKTLQVNIGGFTQRLLDNAKLKQTQEAKLVKLKIQEDLYNRYEALNKYIGSADGDKFRTFAQSLAFDLLVRQANIQLQKMSGRYLLCQDKEQQLEFNVIDNYQGGVVRSTKTLSGGESFIVSLSLALGLSFLSSENVKLDSLFLDEGFGTLDEEALDTAISTLAELPGVEGKTIGLISHVGALTDRISTQIKVIPQNGGKSILMGPGCRRLN
jgi:exonuclease SbcC